MCLDALLPGRPFRLRCLQEFDQATEQGKAMFRRSIDRAEALCLSLSFMQGVRL